MEELKIFSVDGNQIDVNCIYYFSNNNYYLIYTTKEMDENGYVVLNVTKIAREVINTDDGVKATDNLIGLEIIDDSEWKAVQTDISNIIKDKKDNTNTVRYLPSSSLVNLKIKGFRVFRLRPDILKESFGIVLENQKKEMTNENQEFMDYKTKYLDSIDRIRSLEEELNDYKQKISKIKKVLE